VGSRAWRRLYPAATKTAPAIQRLIDRGAQITGHTQMCALHQYQQPTQCIDFQDPWNARADGYQSPSGGSSGQAAAIGLMIGLILQLEATVGLLSSNSQPLSIC
jgi:Asp-tRNA(Asn)/Glu-tRNA(Gln) amidotransferase A subunit family amidase